MTWIFPINGTDTARQLLVTCKNNNWNLVTDIENYLYDFNTHIYNGGYSGYTIFGGSSLKYIQEYYLNNQVYAANQIDLLLELIKEGPQ